MTARESRVLCRQCRANDQLLDRVVADSLAARPVPVPETAASSWTRFSLVLKRACLEGSESNSMDSFVGIRVRVFRWGTPLLCRDVAGLLAQPYVQLCPHHRERRPRVHLWCHLFQGTSLACCSVNLRGQWFTHKYPMRGQSNNKMCARRCREEPGALYNEIVLWISP